MSHFRANVELVKRHYEEAASWKKGGQGAVSLVDNSLLVRLLINKFEFLVLPGTGLISQFFDAHRSPYEQYHIKMEMLRLLVDLFGFPESPLVTRSLKYIDFYISDSYLSFIKLFNSNDFDEATLQMCRLYIEVLIQFSKVGLFARARARARLAAERVTSNHSLDQAKCRAHEDVSTACHGLFGQSD